MAELYRNIVRVIFRFMGTPKGGGSTNFAYITRAETLAESDVLAGVMDCLRFPVLTGDLDFARFDVLSAQLDISPKTIRLSSDGAFFRIDLNGSPLMSISNDIIDPLHAMCQIQAAA